MKWVVITLLCWFLVGCGDLTDEPSIPDRGETSDQFGLSCKRESMLDFQELEFIHVEPSRLYPIEYAMQGEAKRRLGGKPLAKLSKTEIARFSKTNPQDREAAYLVQFCFYVGPLGFSSKEVLDRSLENQTYGAHYLPSLNTLITAVVSLEQMEAEPAPVVFVLLFDKPVDRVLINHISEF